MMEKHQTNMLDRGVVDYEVEIVYNTDVGRGRALSGCSANNSGMEAAPNRRRQ